MYNITIIGEDGGTNVVSIDNLEKSTYKNINIVPKDFLSGQESMNLMAWVGDNSPENLEVIIDKKSLELIKESGQGMFNGLIALDLDKFAHFFMTMETGDIHLVDVCEERISGCYTVALNSGGTSVKVYSNVRPKYIGFPLTALFVEDSFENNNFNVNDFSDICYWLDLSNLKNSAGDAVDFSHFPLLFYIGGGNSIHLPLFFGNKELTLAPVTAEFLEDIPDEYKNVKLTSRKHFNNLNSLENGMMMFMGCSKIKDFPYELPKLSQSALMFAYSGIKEFKINLPSLKNATFTAMQFLMYQDTEDIIEINALYRGIFGMFSNSEIETVVSDMPELVQGDGMFAGCSNLTTFVGSLSSLKSGYNMFGRGCSISSMDADVIDNQIYNVIAALLMYSILPPDYVYSMIEVIPNSAPKLTPMSVINILESLPDRETDAPNLDETDFANSTEGIITEGIITIGIGAYEETKDEFANEIDFETFDELTSAFNEKGWAVDWIFQEATTYARRKNTQTQTLYKLIELKDEIKVTKEANKRFNLPETIKMDDFIKNVQLKSVVDLLKPQYKSNTDSSKKYKLITKKSNETESGWESFETLEEALVHYDISSIEEV